MLQERCTIGQNSAKLEIKKHDFPILNNALDRPVCFFLRFKFPFCLNIDPFIIPKMSDDFSSLKIAHIAFLTPICYKCVQGNALQQYSVSLCFGKTATSHDQKIQGNSS